MKEAKKPKKEEKPKTWRLRDPVHGLIVLADDRYAKDDTLETLLYETDCIALKLIDTFEFQRLRRIRQLGLSSLVFPGATHTRFEHSIGTYHIARQLVRVIARDQGDKFDRRKAQVALLSSLVHDLGHAPLSHVFESIKEAINSKSEEEQEFLKKRPWLGLSHEVWSARIIQYDQDQDGKICIYKVLKDECLCLNCQEGIENGGSQCLIKDIGELIKKKVPNNIYDSIVSSSFDADRLDYLQRDRLMTGVEVGHIDFDWLIDCLEVGTVVEEEKGNTEGSKKSEVLCLNRKGKSVIKDFLLSRLRLYETVYVHKTTRAAEKMIARMLLLIAKDIKKSENDIIKQLTQDNPVLQYLLSEEEPQPNLFLKLDDAQLWATVSVLASPDHSEVIPRNVSKLAKDLQERKLYKVYQESIKPAGKTFDKSYLIDNFKENLEKVREEFGDLPFECLYDYAMLSIYRWNDFISSNVNKKIYVNEAKVDELPNLKDIGFQSDDDDVEMLRGKAIERIYATKEQEEAFEDRLAEVEIQLTTSYNRNQARGWREKIGSLR